jgi:putative ABC transport system substrate-binding protein
MNRREFITLLSAAAAMSSLSVRAQQPSMPVVGFLASASSKHRQAELAAFRRGLAEVGYVEGQNLVIALRWAEGHYDRLPALVADLVQRQVSVIAAIAHPSLEAVKGAHTTIPTVFLVGGDPVASGLVPSLARPGGTITGVTFLANLLAAKQLEVLHELLPNSKSVGVLLNPSNPGAETDTNEVKEAARALARRLSIQHAGMDRDLETAFAMFVRAQVGGVIVVSDPYLLGRSEQILGLTARHSLAAIYPVREFPVAGGLISYGSSLSDAYRVAGVYTGKILSGAKPADLPVMQSTKYELVINLKTARTLGLSIPPSLLARADEVIE